MFCEKCGTKLEATDMYCPKCGNKVSVPKTDMAYMYTGGNALSRVIGNKKILIPAAVAVLAVVIILIVFVFGGGGYKKTVDNFYKAHEKNAPSLMASSVLAQYWLDYCDKGWGEDPLESAQGVIDRDLRDWGCGDNVKIMYEIKGERRATKDDLQALESNIYSWYAYYVYDRDEFSISDAYVLDISFTVVGDNGADNFYYPDGLLVIKENGKWRVTMGSINCSFYDNQ